MSGCADADEPHRDVERRAYHEAGHAIAAASLGFQLHSLSLEVSEQDGGIQSGNCKWVLPGGLDPRAELEARVCIGQSGHIAEHIRFGDGRSAGSDWDWRECLRLCREAGLPNEDADALVGAMAERAHHFIVLRRAALDAVARALVAAGSMEGWAAERLIFG